MATITFESILAEIVAEREYKNSTDYVVDMVNKAQAEQRAQEALLPKREAVQKVVPQKVEDPDYDAFARVGILFSVAVVALAAIMFWVMCV